MCHDLPASGHQGTSRTYARVKESINGMIQVVQQSNL